MRAFDIGERKLAGPGFDHPDPSAAANDRRLLTHEEARVIQEAAEGWLRLREVEFNAGEYAAAVLAGSTLRDAACTRRDIASLGATIFLDVPGEPEPIPITLVRPGEEDLWRGRVSLLSDLGLACIGQERGSSVRIPHGLARIVDVQFPGGRSRDIAEHADADA
jgi:transcription elongation GreA/GreB family factor